MEMKDLSTNLQDYIYLIIFHLIQESKISVDCVTKSLSGIFSQHPGKLKLKVSH